jgi:hypothetical protein
MMGDREAEIRDTTIRRSRLASPACACAALVEPPPHGVRASAEG